MGNYTNLSSDEVKEILSDYSLGKFFELTPLSLGISNSNFKLTVTKNNIKNDYLLKISNDKNHEELIGEQKILEYLNQENFSLSLCPLPNNKGKKVFYYKDHFGVMFPFINGHPPEPGPSTCQEIGKALALLHKMKTPKDRQLREHKQIGYEASYIANFQDDKKCPQEYKDYYKKIFPNNLEAFISNSFQEGIIHGDLYYDNTLFKNDKLVALLDFEQSGIGPLILDIGISISGSCLKKGQIDYSLVESYVKGYETVRALPENEKKHLNNSILLGLFSISLWRIFRFKYGALDPAKKNSYIELLEKANQFYKLIS